MTENKKALREIDRPFYNYWQALYHSFFNNRLYVDVGKRWKGYGILYFLLLLAVTTLPFALRVSLESDKFFKEDVIQPLQQLPPLYIQNGNVSLDKPMPYFIRNKAGQVVVIIDTTGTITGMDGTYPQLSTLITRDRIFYRMPAPHFFFSDSASKNMNPTYVYAFKDDKNEIFNPAEWAESSGVQRLKLVIALLVYPIITMVFFSLFLPLFMAVGLMGQFIAKLFFKTSLSYKQSLRLLLVSSTPCMAVLWLILAAGWMKYTGMGLLLMILLSVYFSYAIISMKRESHKLVRS